MLTFEFIRKLLLLGLHPTLENGSDEDNLHFKWQIIRRSYRSNKIWIIFRHFVFPLLASVTSTKRFVSANQKRKRNLNRALEPAKHKQNLYTNDKVLISYKKTPAVREETAGAIISATYSWRNLLIGLILTPQRSNASAEF